MRIHCHFMLMGLILIINGHVFQAANEHKGIRVRAAFADVVSNHHLQMCIKLLSGQLRQ